MTLPDGFVLDQQQTNLPDGFIIDAHPQAKPTADQISETTQIGRFVHGVNNNLLGTAQLAEHGLGKVFSLGDTHPNFVSNTFDSAGNYLDDYLRGRKQEYNQAKAATGFSGPDFMEGMGEIMSPVNSYIGKATQALPVANKLLGKALMGSGVGASYASTRPVENVNGNYWGQKGHQVETGAAFGAAGPVLGEALARVVRPNVSGGAQALLDEGVRLTPGQITGGGMQRVEDAATSIPLLGDAIKSAQLRGVKDLNIAVANRALNQIGLSVPEGMEAGHGLVEHVKEALGNAYDTLLPKMQGQMDSQFTGELQNLSDMAQYMPEQQAKQFSNIIEKEILNRASPNGGITGESLKDIESAIGKQANGYLGSADQDQRNLGAALGEVQKSFRSMMERNNPQYADELQKINEGYANFTRMRDAAAMQGAKEGIFSPAQLSNAVRRGDMSLRKGNFATGNAMMQDLSDAAKGVMPSTVPDSGSIGRALTGALLAGHFSPEAVTGTAAASLAYTPLGQALMQKVLADRPAGAADLAEAIRKMSSPVVSPLFAAGVSGAPAISEQ